MKIITILFALVVGCSHSVVIVITDTGEEQETIIETEIETGQETETIIEAEIETGQETETIIETEIETGQETETIIETEIETGQETETIIEAEIETGQETETIIETEIETGQETETIIETEIDTNTDIDTIHEEETDIDTSDTEAIINSYDYEVVTACGQYVSTEKDCVDSCEYDAHTLRNDWYYNVLGVLVDCDTLIHCSYTSSGADWNCTCWILCNDV